MKKVTVFFMICGFANLLHSQIDTLGKSPFFFFNTPLETGIFYDSVFCGLRGYISYIADDSLINVDAGNHTITEYAIHMYSEDTIKIVGIALGYHQSYYPIKLSINDYDNISLATTITPPLLYDYYTVMDSNYLCFLEIPGWNHNIINAMFYWGDPRYVWLSFFEEGIALDMVGDFYVGISEEDGFIPLHLFVDEVHESPYHIPSRPIRVRRGKIWEDDTIERAIPILFPIIEPRCRAVDEVRTTIDSAGCLVAEWDSLPYQEQWVVALNVQGHAGTVLDTVDSCRWHYCGLPTGASYQISVRSRCTNLNSYTWSPWNNPIELGIASAETDNAFSVSPNPTTGLVRLSLPPSATRGSHVEVYSIDGRRMVSRDLAPYSTTATIDLGTLPSGIYIVTLQTHYGTTHKRLIKK